MMYSMCMTLSAHECLQRRKDLTAAEGHVVLLEYFEEFPLFLSHPGQLTHAC